MAFLETGAFVGLIAPGETVVIFGGLVAGQGEINVVVLIGIVWACAVAGDTTSFFLGRRLGREFLLKHGPGCRSPRSASSRSRASSTATAARRSSSGASSGSCARSPRSWPARRGMPLGASCPTTSSAPALWATTFCLLGYIFWQSFDQRPQLAKQGALALGTTIAVVVGAVWPTAICACTRTATTAGAGSSAGSIARALRPLRAASSGRHRARRPRRRPARLRFFWDRVTPGELGLELTTLLAVAAVGAFAFFGLAIAAGRRDAARRRPRRPSTSRRRIRTALARRRRARSSRTSARSRCVVAGRARGRRVLLSRRRRIGGAWFSPPGWSLDVDRRAHREGRRRPPAARRTRSSTRPTAELSRPGTPRTRSPGSRWRSSLAPAPSARRAARRRRRRGDRCSPSPSASTASTCARTTSPTSLGGLGAGGRDVRGLRRSSGWSSPSCGTMGRATHEQHVDHLSRRRLRGRLRARGLRRPDPRARLDRLQPRLGARRRGVPVASTCWPRSSASASAGARP